ncbi:M48 family metallopeptidase [Candidatus Woesearchaeota archaeon]|nr:M48 family metallopeptidase [Candidatus Woesearchaeota archaeon]
MGIAEEAFRQLYPEKENGKNFILKYTARFKPYNANVRYRGNAYTFNLSKSWRKVSNEIQIGLLQELMAKIFRDKRKTVNMELYNMFIKNLHISAPKTETHPLLEDSFNRNNEKFFNGFMERPNLVWGSFSTRKLGCYEYASDTITISQIFRHADPVLMDYVMYHEMLHKKYKFNSKNGRNHHHTRHFKEMEMAFPDSKKLEEDLGRLASRHYLQDSRRNPINNLMSVVRRFV